MQKKTMYTNRSFVLSLNKIFCSYVCIYIYIDLFLYIVRFRVFFMCFGAYEFTCMYLYFVCAFHSLPEQSI